MQMNHPLWPVVRESARRIVKSDSIIISAPMEFADLINQLADYIGEKIPQRANLPKHQVSDSKGIEIYQMNSGNPEQIIYIGNVVPNVEVCWVEMEIAEGFIAIIESCQQLLDAGYPGCVGCEGSIQEGRWNEIEFRHKRN